MTAGERDLSKRRYVYLWADGVYSNVRMDDRLCLLVIVGSDDTGRKEVLADVVEGVKFNDGERVEPDQLQDTAEAAIQQI